MRSVWAWFQGKFGIHIIVVGVSLGLASLFLTSCFGDYCWFTKGCEENASLSFCLGAPASWLLTKEANRGAAISAGLRKNMFFFILGIASLSILFNHRSFAVILGFLVVF